MHRETQPTSGTESDRVTRRSFLRTTGVAAAAGLAGIGCRRESSDPEASPPDPKVSISREEEPTGLFKAPPALFRANASGCTVQWVPDGSVDLRVRAGAADKPLELVGELTSDAPSAVVIDRFSPNDLFNLQCEYRRSGQATWTSLPVQSVRASRQSGQTFRVALVADSHVYSCSAGERNKQRSLDNLRKTSSAVLEDRPDFAIFLGDEAGVHFVFDPEDFMSQKNAIERWRNWRTEFAPLLAAIPSCLVIGNHEGEAGYYQVYRGERGRYFPHYLQRWGTIARKSHCLNPLPSTHPEGGENAGWSGDQSSPATGGADEGNCSPLENYYAWTWGDALFVVLDVHRYTRIGSAAPATPEDWTLGETQITWLKSVLAGSSARWKFVLGHHLVGGWPWEARGVSKGIRPAYGRGGGRYARVGEQARITDLMNETGARFFLYGHDHIFSHQVGDGIDFVCCGRPTSLNPRWFSTPGWKEAYGDLDARDPHDYYAAVGYTRLTVAPDHVLIEYIRTGTNHKPSENVTQEEGEVVYSHRWT